MMTPARLSRDRKLAALTIDTGANEDRPNQTAYEQMLMKLKSDQSVLSTIKSGKGKIDKKRELIPDYNGWVAGVLEGGSTLQDEVFLTLMIWRIDVGDLEGALPLFLHAHKAKMVLPERFKRDLPTFVLEQVSVGILDALTTGQAMTDAELGVLSAILDATEDHDMHDVVRAKALKAMGRAIAADLACPPAALESAVDFLKQAMELDGACGVKRDIEVIERRLKAAGGTAAPADAA